MYQVQVAVGNMPINLLLLSNGYVAFVRVANFKALFDQSKEGDIVAMFYEEDFTVGAETFQYNTSYAYKEIPDMLAWLKAQELIKPVIQHF